MSIMKIFGIVLVLILFFSCKPEKGKLMPKKTIIAGIVENYNNSNVLIINFCDPLENDSDQKQFAQKLSESQGYFHAEYEYVFAQNITIRYRDEFINLFINPGDSIFVAIDGNLIEQEIDYAVEFSGDNADLNEELFKWTNHAYNNIPIFNFNANDPPKKFIADIRQNLKVVQDSINAYSDKNGMSDFLKNWAFIDYKYLIANYIMDYNGSEDKWAVFTDPVFDLFNEQNFHSMYFMYHLLICLKSLTYNDEQLSALIMDGGKYDSYIELTIEKLFDKTPKGTIRDVMVYYFLQNIIQNIPEALSSFDNIDLDSMFSEPLFAKKLSSLVQYIQLKKQGQQLTLTESLNNRDVLYLSGDDVEEVSINNGLLQYLAEKYANKVIYIDVWATWCGPCIAEMKKVPELHKYYKGEDVVFVNICMESCTDKWAQTIKTYSIEGENYFLNDDYGKLFRANNNLPGFPSYLLIDKTKLLYNPVSKPSEMETTIKTINLHLDKKP